MPVTPCSLLVRAVLLEVVLLALTAHSVTPGPGQGSVRMVPTRQCPGQAIAWAHTYWTGRALSVLECLVLCRPHEACLSIVYDVGQQLCHLANATSANNCSNTITACPTCRYFETTQQTQNAQQTQCQNGGVMTAEGENCTCPDGFFGDYCDVTAKDCDAYSDQGWLIPTEDVYMVKPALASEPFSVVCQILTSGLLRTHVAVRKMEPSVSFFNRSWHDYRAGFGSPGSKEYWLGLEQLHQLTQGRDYQLRFNIKLSNGTNFFQYYENCVVEDEASGYAISFHQPVEIRLLGDCLSDLVGAPFSTYDADNDNSSAVHCAQQHGAGWWFRGDNCSTCNPLGPILSPFNGWRKGVDGEAFWTRNLGDRIPFTLYMYLVAMT